MTEVLREVLGTGSLIGMGVLLIGVGALLSGIGGLLRGIHHLAGAQERLKARRGS